MPLPGPVPESALFKARLDCVPFRNVLIIAFDECFTIKIAFSLIRKIPCKKTDSLVLVFQNLCIRQQKTANYPDHVHSIKEWGIPVRIILGCIHPKQETDL